MTYRYGKINNQDVRTALLVLLNELPSECVAVIRCIDSSHGGPDICRMLNRYKVPHFITGGHVWARSNELTSSRCDQLFFGFDEAWLFAREVPSIAFDGEMILTSDCLNLAVEIPNDLKSAVDNTQPIAAFGDGCGLNYVISDGDFGESVLRRLLAIEPLA